MKGRERLGFGREVKKRAEGAIAERIEEEELEQTTAFARFGFLPELIGRFNRMVSFEPLDEPTLREILEGNVLGAYAREFAHEGLELEVAPEVLKRMVEGALKRETGARGLRAALAPKLEEAAYAHFGSPGVHRAPGARRRAGARRPGLKLHLTAQEPRQHLRPAEDHVRRRAGEAEPHVVGEGPEAGPWRHQQAVLDAALQEPREPALVQVPSDVHEEEGAALRRSNSQPRGRLAARVLVLRGGRRRPGGPGSLQRPHRRELRGRRRAVEGVRADLAQLRHRLGRPHHVAAAVAGHAVRLGEGLGGSVRSGASARA